MAKPVSSPKPKKPPSVDVGRRRPSSGAPKPAPKKPTRR